MASAVIERLRAQIQSIGPVLLGQPQRCVSSSIPQVDEFLPHGGLSLGSFVELLEASPGIGGYSLALVMARCAIKDKPLWAVLDTEGSFSPPAAEALGWDLRNLIVVRAQPKDGGWCFAQLLRSKDFGACFWLADSMDNMVFRRLQLAGEQGGGLGFCLRPFTALRKPCWGSLRLRVQPCGTGKVRLRILHARGQPAAPDVEIEVAL